jgi:hypothetical protein
MISCLVDSNRMSIESGRDHGRLPRPQFNAARFTPESSATCRRRLARSRASFTGGRPTGTEQVSSNLNVENFELSRLNRSTKSCSISSRASVTLSFGRCRVRRSTAATAS